MINNYCANINDFTEKDYTLMQNMIDFERKSIALKYLHKKDYQRCLLGGMLLNFALYQTYNKIITPHILKNKNGKPYVNNINNFHYNISHSGSWVVLATSPYEIGVDIEEITEHSELLHNLDFILSETEHVFLKNTCEEQCMSDIFIQIWTMKESYLKYKGTGLSEELNSFSVIQTDCNDSTFINGIISKKFSEHYYLSLYSEKDFYYCEKIVSNDDFSIFYQIYNNYNGE